MKPNILIILVDFQKEWTRPEGKAYVRGDSINFVQKVLVPHIANETNFELAVIMSDYRNPRPGGRGECAVPGTPGFELDIPAENITSTFIKCMNSPVWARSYIGLRSFFPSKPYPEHERFQNWIQGLVTREPRTDHIALAGLTLDCCILCTAIELKFMGWQPYIIEEATDVASGDPDEKETVLRGPIIKNFAEPKPWSFFVE